jgi:hypothetical protein
LQKAVRGTPNRGGAAVLFSAIMTFIVGCIIFYQKSFRCFSINKKLVAYLRLPVLKLKKKSCKRIFFYLFYFY